MVLPTIAAIGSTLFGVLLSLVAIFLILLVLVQRGRGGGLAGALGGMGGSSAFGAKAGDVFTKITIVAAFVWIVLCIAATRFGSTSQSLLDIPDNGAPAASSDVTPEGDAAASTGPAEAEDDAAKAPAASEATPPAEPAADPANPNN